MKFEFLIIEQKTLLRFETIQTCLFLYAIDLIIRLLFYMQGGNDHEIYESERTVGHTGNPLL